MSKKNQVKMIKFTILAMAFISKNSSFDQKTASKLKHRDGIWDDIDLQFNALLFRVRAIN
jgi:hypothetical protein